MQSQAKTAARTVLGDNKAIAALTFETEGDKLELGVIVHIPTGQAEGKTFYKPLGMKVNISAAQRDEIIRMLGGSPPCPTT
jgi:hypothetical protein